VQNSGTNITTNSTTGTASLTGIAAQKGLVCLFTKGNSDTAAVSTVTDTQGNTWTRAAGTDSALNSRRVDMWFTNSSASGSITVTVTLGNASQFRVEIIELSKYVAVDASGTNSNSSNTNTFNCAASTALDTIANTILISAVALNSSVTSFAAGSGFTLISSNPSTSPNNVHGTQSGQFEAAQTDNRCAITTTGTTRQGPGICASFKEATPPSIFPRRRRESQRSQAL
jgi:hypothetical protein